MAFLLELLTLAVVGFSVAVSYYSFPIHAESYSGYVFYFLLLILVYGIYKSVQLFYKKSKIRLSPVKIAGYALVNILLLCFAFADANAGANSVVLFFKIIGYSILPIVLTLVSYSFSKTVLGRIPGFLEEDSVFQILINLGFGFIAFLTPLIIAGIFGQYHVWSMFSILIIFGAIAHKELYSTCKSLVTYEIELDNHRATDNFFENINLYLLSTEFFFLVLTFLIGVNLINIVRPMPIGWDDLGVYMNLPNIIARNGVLLAGNAMTAWQAFTGIGFMFKSTAQAFFLSDLGGILALLTTIFSVSYFTSEKRKYFLNLPLLAGTILFAMPMVVFQQAKDIKVDLGLYFISAIAIFAAIYLGLKYLGYSSDSQSEAKDASLAQRFISVIKGENGMSSIFESKSGLFYILLIGIFAGFAFSIKFTSLMLILALFGMFAYIKLGLSGFLGYFFAFIGVFTKLGLWNMMNVNYPKDDAALVSMTSIICLILAVISLAYGTWRHGLDSLKKFAIISAVFTLGVILSLSPWLAKNISEAGLANLTINTLLNGKGKEFFPDYTKILDKNTLATIEKQQAEAQAISSSGKTLNEDLGRYFGYENGVNNYLKLPYNLTMQINQPGEYTDITFLFLALLPVILLFLGYRHPSLALGVVVGGIVAGIYFFIPENAITGFFATKFLPAGYLWIIGAFLVPLPYFLYSLNASRSSQIFRLLLVISTIYCLIFVVAAYGIVWYGISMYFIFIAMICVSAICLTHDDGTEGKENMMRFLGGVVLLAIVSIYVFNSVIPHGFKNLANAGFKEFKSGQVTQEEGVFGAHPDYYAILTELNLNDKKVAYDTIVGAIKNVDLAKVIKQYGQNDVNRLATVLQEILGLDTSKISADPVQASIVKSEAKTTLNTLYDLVLYPKPELRNSKNIYRIGTFLTYFIDNNRTRYFDDSLVSSFDTYFFDKDPDVTVERMKKIGLSYLLVDLNAATIDKDPRHDLTRRYENLLSTFRSSKLELVQTDSICLRLALDEKDPNYMTYAGVNFESYKDGKTIGRREKFYDCMKHISDLSQTGKITTTGKYSYLVPLVQFIQAGGQSLTNEKFNQAFDAFHGWLALFRIK